MVTFFFYVNMYTQQLYFFILFYLGGSGRQSALNKTKDSVINKDQQVQMMIVKVDNVTATTLRKTVLAPFQADLNFF